MSRHERNTIGAVSPGVSYLLGTKPTRHQVDSSDGSRHLDGHLDRIRRASRICFAIRRNGRGCGSCNIRNSRFWRPTDRGPVDHFAQRAIPPDHARGRQSRRVRRVRRGLGHGHQRGRRRRWSMQGDGNLVVYRQLQQPRSGPPTLRGTRSLPRPRRQRRSSPSTPRPESHCGASPDVLVPGAQLPRASRSPRPTGSSAWSCRRTAISSSTTGTPWPGPRAPTRHGVLGGHAGRRQPRRLQQLQHPASGPPTLRGTRRLPRPRRQRQPRPSTPRPESHCGASPDVLVVRRPADLRPVDHFAQRAIPPGHARRTAISSSTTGRRGLGLGEQRGRRRRWLCRETATSLSTAAPTTR